MVAARGYAWLVVIAAAIVGGGAFLFVNHRGSDTAIAAPSPVERKEIAGPVGCTGHVEPEGGITVVAAAPALGRTPVVARLMVREGQKVTAGQTIATLESLPELQGAVKQAEARVAVAQSRVAQLQAGARTGDVLALKSEIERLELESKAAHQELERKDALARKDFVPRVQVETARLKSDDLNRQLEGSRHRLESLTDVRGSDLDLARAESAAADADLNRARIQLEAGTVRAPAKGMIIQIRARAGEAVGPEGVVTLADTGRMNVIAEIYETDITRVHAGQRAVITSDLFSEPIHGVVGWISPQIENAALPLEPSAAADRRVYQARIKVDQKLDHPEQLARYINAKVNVRIEP
jgi:HlyD family secretion protein